MQYSIIPSNTHVPQAFTHLEQGLDKLLSDYLHCVRDPLYKIYHTSDMSRISAEGANHYAVVSGLNRRMLKDDMAGQGSVQWKMMEECYRNIHNTGTGYE